MNLKELTEHYLSSAGGYGKSVALGSLGYSHEEIEIIFNTLDEDYHISRYFHLSNETGETFDVNGFPQTHVSIDPEIKEIL
jgi:hypothetical protein